MGKLQDILQKKVSGKCVWFMRQAGRYLPEFRDIRLKNPNFIKLCLNSELSSEISLQPIKRFDIDSAIIFSDILMVPYAIGQDVNFTSKYGPKLSSFNLSNFLKNDDKNFSKKLEPVYKSIEITRKKLDNKKSLISFIGAPWTLLVYMFDLKESKNTINLEKFNNKKKEIINILDKLIEYLCIHIKNQIRAGAEVVQIFDSWAGLIPKEYLSELCYKPNARIVEFCKIEKIPNICFPKGIKKNYKDFCDFVCPDGINIDPEIDPMWAKRNLKNVVIQGGLDPQFLLKTEEEMIKEATKYIQTFNDAAYIFNLGHGLLPETNPDKVKTLINFYRKY